MTNNEAPFWGTERCSRIDATGRLPLLPALIARYGLQPGAEVQLDQNLNNLQLRRPITSLAKVYIEPTNCCNLNCVTCMRNIWDEPMGAMDEATFSHILAGLRAFSPPPNIFFGGLGEPTAHPRLAEMVAQTKSFGATVEVITNGTLLTEPLSRQLIAAGLDRLWVSLDGATPESYADVRLGAELPQVIANLTRFRDLRHPSHHPTPEIGIAFVAMKRNIGDLPALLNLADHLGASRFLVTNVLPYTEEMCDEILYARALNDIAYLASSWVPQISLPKIDIDETTRVPLYRVLRSNRSIRFAGVGLDVANNFCPFIEAGVTAIGWNGNVSPCLPLLHTHVSYLNRYPRQSRCYVVGNVTERTLSDLWRDPAYLAFRKRVQAFEFAPCTFCGGCELSRANEEDCYGNRFPVCGGCLWAQGVIQCP